jgi:hypothetical protein
MPHLSPQGIFILYVIFMAAVGALEAPPATANYFLHWAYRFLNALAINLQKPPKV